jgi:disulfide bond formation protein DsbB
MTERWREAAAPLVALLISAGTILGALYSQFVLGFQPCHLCLEERIPYYIGVPVVALAVVSALAGAQSRLIRLIMAVAGVIFAVGVYLGVNHAGIELNWWPGPSDCSPTGVLDSIHTTQDLLHSLSNTRIVPCNQAVWWFLGLSFAGWNAVMSAVLVLVSAFAAAGGLSRDRSSAFPIPAKPAATPSSPAPQKP